MTAPAPVASMLTERLEAPLAPLERLPRGLWLGALVHSHGPLVPRLESVERLREALLAGRGPDPAAAWPHPPLAREQLDEARQLLTRGLALRDRLR